MKNNINKIQRFHVVKSYNVLENTSRIKRRERYCETKTDFISNSFCFSCRIRSNTAFPPSIVDAVTGATTKAKKEVQESAQLEGNYVFCMNTLSPELNSENVRDEMKTIVLGTSNPVLPGIHYFMGGIYVDEQHRTAFKNLYAAGECCAQYHGANRLGGNSLLGAIYGGRVAAKTAYEEAKSMDLSNSINEIFSPKELKPYVKKQLNGIMLETLGVLQNESLLQKGSREICELEGTLPLLGLSIIESALARKESRRAHMRTDYPEQNDSK